MKSRLLHTAVVLAALIALPHMARGSATALERSPGPESITQPVSIGQADRRAAGQLTSDASSTEVIDSPQGQSQLLGNPGFENAAWSPWETIGATGLDSGVKHSGTRSAHLGNANGANAQVLQRVTIPANASGIVLDFWYRFSTNETTADADYFYAGLWDQAGSTNYVLLWADFSQAGSVDWTRETYTLSAEQLASVAGKTVLFGLVVETNGALTSRAWVDDAALQVTTPTSGSAHKVFLPLMVKPQPGSPPVIHQFTANPASIAPGGSSRLSWNVTGATSLSISPGIGAVTGSSRVVNPPATTEYTLVATNAYGSSHAKATVVVGGAAPSGSFFIVPVPDIDRPTSHPTVKVDAAGGVHVVFTPDSASQQNPTRSALYAYCPSNCTSAAAFTIVPLGDNVVHANLALDNAGHPRLLLRLSAPSGSMHAYQYWTCDANCVTAGQWHSAIVAYAYPRSFAQGEPFSRFFALDHLGRPRFVYYDSGADNDDPHWGVYYAACDGGCLAPANWHEARLLDDTQAVQFALAFSPAGQPRLAYASYDSENIQWSVGYAECSADCGNATGWRVTRLANTVSASVTEFAVFALRADSNGRPRLALYTGTGLGGSLAPNTLYFLSCDAANCAQGQAWQALNLGLSQTHGEAGVDLALDSQNRPRIAYHAPLAAGYGLYYAWCNTNCGASASGWQYKEVEPSEKVNQELPIPPWPGCAFPQCNPPIPPCTFSSWNTGVRPSLALEAAGNPRIAYDADHEQGGGCGSFTDTRLTRFALFNQP